jgi:hypothetical protein
MAAILALHSVGNAIILHNTVFPLLENDSLLMVCRSLDCCARTDYSSKIHRLTSFVLPHRPTPKAHTDPSIIIGTPFPLEKLFLFITISLMWRFGFTFVEKLVMNRESQSTRNDEHRSYHPVIVIAMHTIFIHFIFIMCGVQPAILPLHTLLSAFYVSFITPQSIHRILATNYWSSPSQQQQQQQQQFPIEHSKTLPRTKSNRLRICNQLTTLGTIIGMIACSILRILDHGMQIQRHPIPIIVGATWGSCGGAVLTMMLSLLGYVQKRIFA